MKRIYSLNSEADVLAVVSNRGRVLSFLEFFYHVDDVLVNLLSVSTLREDENSFRKFYRQKFDANSMQPISFKEEITKDIYYTTLLTIPVEKVFTELIYKEERENCVYTLAVEQESKVGLIEIDCHPSCSRNCFSSPPRRFEKFLEGSSKTDYEDLGIAFFDKV